MIQRYSWQRFETFDRLQRSSLSNFIIILRQREILRVEKLREINHPRINLKKNLSNRRILRKNQEKLRELEERSMTGGKMECIIEGTDNSKESSLSLSKYRNLYSVNNRLAIVRPALCSGMSHALRIIDRPCVEHRRL